MPLAVDEKHQVSESIEYIVQVEAGHKARQNNVPYMHKRFPNKAAADALAASLRGLGIRTSVRRRVTTTIDHVLSVK